MRGQVAVMMPAVGRRRPTGDTGSMPLAMLLVIVASGMSVVLMTIVFSEVRTSRVDIRRTDAINAAQTGLDVAVARLRASTDAGGDGDYPQLPCGPLGGPVSAGKPAAYTVTIYYLAAAPPAGDVAWAAANKLGCPLLAVPGYALLRSVGTATAGEAARTVVATYTFHTATNGNIPGGLIHAEQKAGPDLCMAAQTDPPSAGQRLLIMNCATGSRLQSFTYEAGLNLVLVGSRTAARPGGMCLDAGNPPATGNYVVFQPCATGPTAPIPQQVWSQNDLSAFQGTTDGVNLNKWCFGIVSPQTPGSQVRLADSSVNPADIRNACYGNWSDNKSFFPDAAVGTGRAGAATHQLVNYRQLGRCVDVTGNDPSRPYLVVFPCKQTPSGPIQWNQNWTLPTFAPGATSATGPIYTKWTVTAGFDNKFYCLSSPGSTAPAKYVLAKQCVPTAPSADLLWTVRKDTGLYSTSNRIESTYQTTAGSPYCLTPTDPDDPAPDLWTLYGLDMSKVVLDACTNSTLQKWNGSSSIVTGPLHDVVEP